MRIAGKLLGCDVPVDVGRFAGEVRVVDLEAARQMVPATHQHDVLRVGEQHWVFVCEAGVHEGRTVAIKQPHPLVMAP